MPQVTLHTINNTYDDGCDYHQYVQIGRTPMLRSPGVRNDNNLGDFLTGLIDDLNLDEKKDGRVVRLLERTIQRGEVNRFLIYAERINLRECECEDMDGIRTRFGEWTYTADEIVAPNLREQQDDVWEFDPAYPVEDWRYEVQNGDVTTGYWEWVARMREVETDEPNPMPGKPTPTASP